MATEDEYLAGQLKKFNISRDKIKRLQFKDSEDFSSELSNYLDDINSVDYSLKVVSEENVGDILAKCCYLVSCREVTLLQKFCQVIVNLVSRQQLVLVTHVETVAEFLVTCLRDSDSTVRAHLLRALSAVVYENTHKLSKFHEDLVGKNGILTSLSDRTVNEVQRNNTQCIENLCLRVPGCNYLSDSHQQRCHDVLLDFLLQPPPPNRDDSIYCRVTNQNLWACLQRVVSCLRGIHNLAIGTKSYPPHQLGAVLGVLKVFMLYGLPGQHTTAPTTLFSQPMPIPIPVSHPPKNQPPAKQADSVLLESLPDQGEVSLRPGGSASGKAGRKGGRRRGGSRGDGRGSTGAGHGEGQGSGKGSSSSGAQNPQTDGLASVSGSDPVVASLLQPWRQGYSSESDLSDTEGGGGAKLRLFHSNVRHCSMVCLLSIVKVVERSVLFGYWSAFLPDSPVVGAPTQGHTLFTSIMKDPSPKVRSSSLLVLSALVEGSKQFLSNAEDSDHSRAAFTPFSVSLGYMVKELHRGLLFSLAAEHSPLVLTQIFKCLATLIPNVPYHKLRPGLLHRIIKQIKPFLAHKEANIHVACLTCLGSVISVHAPMMEVWQALQTTPGSAPTQAPPSPSPTTPPTGSTMTTSQVQPLASPESPRLTPGIVTPTLSSGSLTPSLIDCTVGSGELPWIVRLCVRNVCPSLVEADRTTSRASVSQPQPVKLESLQLLAQLSKGYFILVENCLMLLCELVHKCLEDSHTSVQLHGAKLLEEMAAAILQQLKQERSIESVDLAQVEELWVRVLSGPLTQLPQEPQYFAVRATACDCLANVGPQVFEKLQVAQRMLCITLLLGFSSDPDYHVRASAVRALGVYVLYPCLREDVSFVADVANTLITSLQESSLSVKIKAAWSLGNLGDAIVLNRDAGDQAFVTDFADMLLLKLFEVATRAAQDDDKVKANAVRGLGSLLRYLPPRSYNSVRFSTAVEQGIKSLVKTVSSGTMKIRWNACYATANMFRNPLLPLGEAAWTIQIHSALAGVVRSCKNFKVRINAALAFSVPRDRHCYGDASLFSRIWESLILGLVESEAVTDFAEFKYRDSLIRQVCRTLLHLASLTTQTDLALLSPIVNSHSTALSPFLQQFCRLSRKDPPLDDLDHLSNACQHLRSLESLEGTPGTTARQLREMLDGALAESLNPSSRPCSPGAASFSQTYT